MWVLKLNMRSSKRMLPLLVVGQLRLLLRPSQRTSLKGTDKKIGTVTVYSNMQTSAE